MRSYVNNLDLREQISSQDIFLNFKLDQIQTALDKQKSEFFSPYFIVSLIRQESAFNHKAVSSAKARGLMQMIPPTAKTVAKELGRKRYDLNNIEDNLSFGVHYLDSLMKEFDQNIVYSLAGYNAGPTAAKRWIKSHGHLENLYFIDSIPYQETRSYVKLILRNYIFYQLIYQQKKISNLSVYQASS